MPYRGAADKRIAPKPNPNQTSLRREASQAAGAAPTLPAPMRSAHRHGEFLTNRAYSLSELAEPIPRDRPKTQPKTRINPPDSLRREASQAAGAAPTLPAPMRSAHRHGEFLTHWGCNRAYSLSELAEPIPRDRPKTQPKTRINPPDSLRREASQAAGAAPTLRYGPAGDSAPRLRLKASGMAERFPFGFAAMNDNILYHALARPRTPRPDPPLSPRKQRVFRIGPEPSRARSGEANP